MPFPKRTKKCKTPSCGKTFLPERTLQETCSVPCAIELANYKLEKKKVRDAKRKKEKYYETKLPHQLTSTQNVFNEFIRWLDLGEKCITCGRNQCGSFWDCGHCLTVAAHKHIRFDPRNAFKQGSGCNRSQSKYKANEDTMRVKYFNNIEIRKGSDYVLWLKGNHPELNYNCHDLIFFRNEILRPEIKLLKAGDPPSRDWRSLDYSMNEFFN